MKTGTMLQRTVNDFESLGCLFPELLPKIKAFNDKATQFRIAANNTITVIISYANVFYFDLFLRKKQS
jgi:hypothetical protein